MDSKRDNFLREISFRENETEANILDRVMKNQNLLKDMSIEQLKKVNVAIKNRQSILKRKREALKNEIAIEKFKRKRNNG